MEGGYEDPVKTSRKVRKVREVLNNYAFFAFFAAKNLFGGFHPRSRKVFACVNDVRLG